MRGALGGPAPQSIIGAVKRAIDGHDGPIIFTLDTHDTNYLKTSEGRKLPVEHCIEGTWGHGIIAELQGYIGKPDVTLIKKPNFGYSGWQLKSPSEITIAGLVSDICVVSNALILKAKYPEIPVRVLSAACAGTSVDAHDAAMRVMASCQVEVV